MKHPRTIVATIAAGAALLAVPGIAHADPVVTATSSGDIVGSISTGARGQWLHLSGRDCVNPAGGQTYMGSVAALGEDPATASVTFPTQFATDASGNFDTDVQIPMENGLGTFQARFYCTTDATPALTGPTVLWSSPVYTMEIDDAPAAPPPTLMALGRSSVMKVHVSAPAVQAVGLAAAPSDGDTEKQATLTLNPDSLPLVDRIGIQGPDAAALKAKVDAHAEHIAEAQRLYMAFLNRVGDHPGMEYWVAALDAGTPSSVIADQFSQTPEFLRSWGNMRDVAFVKSGFRIVLGRQPSPAESELWLGRLSAGTATRAEFVQALADSPENVQRSANFNYVVAAYQTFGKGTPSKAQVQKFADQLDEGQVKVQVVENIALSLHDAGWWADAVQAGTI